MLFRSAIRVFVWSAAAAAVLGIIQFFAQFLFGTEKVFSLWVHGLLPFFLGPEFSEAVASYQSLLVNISGKTFLRATALFPDPHMFAFFLGMAFPIALYSAYHSERISTRRSLFFASGLIVLCDFLTFSRGGYVGLEIGRAHV